MTYGYAPNEGSEAVGPTLQVIEVEDISIIVDEEEIIVVLSEEA